MVVQINWLSSTRSWGKEIAEHRDTSIATLRELAGHPDIEVRTAVAEHRNTPLEIVMTLAHDKSVDLRYSLAENHNVHVDVLTALRDDENPFVANRANKTLQRLRYGLIVAFPLASFNATISSANRVDKPVFGY